MQEEQYLKSINRKFSRMLDSKTQSYKFYWLEAILELSMKNDDDIFFDDIINEMICEAWYTVTEYHLKLGPTINGKCENYLEHAIKTLYSNTRISENPKKEEIITVIKTNENLVKDDKKGLLVYVPHKILHPFVENDNEGRTYLNKDQRTKLFEYLIANKARLNPFYTVEGDGGKKRVCIDEKWRRFLSENYSIIKSWIQYRKVIFLQDRNPGVPGIVYKLESEKKDSRRLEHARELWIASVKFMGKPIHDIYLDKDLSLDRFDLDHFIPRSYIANDELWNLTPMDKKLNGSKNNRLPVWEEYFDRFARYHFQLYKSVFLMSDNGNIRELFEKCRKDNVNSIWATETLYINGHSMDSFIDVLSRYLKPIYDSAYIQGFGLWKHNG